MGRVDQGQIPPGPPQIRTCRFPASGSSSHGFATRRAVTPSRTLWPRIALWALPAPVSLSVRVSLRCSWRSVAPFSFPPTVPLPGAALCSAGSLGQVPPLHCSYAALRLPDTHCATLHCFASPYLSYSAGGTRASRGSWGTLACMPCSATPGQPPRRTDGLHCPSGASVLSSAKTRASTCPTSHISELNGRAYMLAVYASPPPSPADTQDSLPAGGQPWPGSY